MAAQGKADFAAGHDRTIPNCGKLLQLTLAHSPPQGMAAADGREGGRDGGGVTG
jgi:hypothetical protein